MRFDGFGCGFGGAVRAAPQAAICGSNHSMTITPALTPRLVLATILLDTTVSTLAGIIPAWSLSTHPGRSAWTRVST